MAKGAGQFNLLEAIPEELWDQLEMMKKAKKINKKIKKGVLFTRLPFHYTLQTLVDFTH
jgi:rRNA pseudouridine-1189 N-methylase Emg1 (Nep1/Mra1 family)